MHAGRVIVGLVAATVATPIAIVLAFALARTLDIPPMAGQSWSQLAGHVRVYVILGAPVAAFVTLGFGAPLTHRRIALGRATALRTALTGLVIGALPFLVFDGYIIGFNLLLLVDEPYTPETLRRMATFGALGGWCGMCSALAYWAVVVPRTPRPAAPKPSGNHGIPGPQ